MASSARYLTLAALFSIPFIPLVVTTSLFFPFITGKGFVFRILVEVALAGYVLLALADRAYRPQFSWILVLYGALVAWMFIADLAGVNPGKAFWSNYERMDGFVTLIHVFLFFIIAGVVLTKDGLWRRWWLTFLAAAALVTLYSLMQITCAPDGCNGSFRINQGGVRVDGTMGNAAYLACFMLFSIGVSVWQATVERGTLRWSLVALALLNTVVLFYTATRSAIIAFIAAAGVSSLTALYLMHGKARRAALVALAAFVLLLGAFYLARDTDFVREDPTLARLASISLADGQTRFTIWGMAWEGAKERPILGWGQEGFNHIFNRWYEPSMFAQEPWFDRAHNLYIDWLVAGGFPALFIFVGLLGSALFYLLARNVLSRPERVMLAAIVTAYMVNAFFIFDNLWSYVPLAAVLAYIHARVARPVTRLEALPELAEPSLSTIAAPAALVVGIVLIWVVNVPSLLAANRLVSGISNPDVAVGIARIREASAMRSLGAQEIAEQSVTYAGTIIMAPQVPVPLKQQAAALAVELMAKEIEKQPEDARLRIQYSTALRNAGDYAGAVREMQAARALSPKKQQIYLQEAYLEWERGNKSRAAELFREAYAIDPSFAELAIYVAAGALITGQPAEADRILTEVFGTTDIDRPVLLYAYAEAGRSDRVVMIWEARARTGGANEKYQLALAYKAAGRVADARRTVEETVTEYPDTAGLGREVIAEIEKP